MKVIIILLLLSRWANASTEIKHLENNALLPKEMMKIILEYLPIQDYVHFITINQALYHRFAPNLPQRIYDQYRLFLITDRLEPAGLRLWTRASDFFSATEMRRQVRLLEYHPTLLFFPTFPKHGKIPVSPSLLCSTLREAPEETKILISKFFQQHPDDFNCVDCSHSKLTIYFSENRVLPLVYDSLTDQLYLWINDITTLKIFRIYLPSMLVLSDHTGNNIHIERAGGWQTRHVEISQKKLTLSLTSWTLKADLYLDFNVHTGYLYQIHIISDNYLTSHRFNLQSNCQYILRDNFHYLTTILGYSIITAFYSPPFNFEKNKRI